MSKENNVYEIDIKNMVILMLFILLELEKQKCISHGRYICDNTDCNNWIAIDNTTSEALAKVFMDKEKALEWLNSKEKLKNELQADLGGT